MITISLKSHNKSTKYTFSKERIVIGSDETADIALDKSSLEHEHLIILLEHDRYKAINKANDPFVSLNKLPFGKRSIKAGDHLHLHDFEVEVVDIQITDGRLPSVPKKSKEKFTIEPLLETKSLPETKTLPVETASKAPEKKVQEQNVSQTKDVSRPRFSILMVFVAILAATGIYFFSILPEYVTQPHGEKETSLAVADVAMALLYAQINQLTPDKLDWSSSKTLQELMRHLLPSRDDSAFHAEGQDTLAAGQYAIHIYHNVNGDHFIVIARPEWISWFTWWKSHPVILLDSKDMRLRKIQDVTPYQRLFALHPELNKENERWINSLLEHEEIIPLSSLDARSEKFSSIFGKENFVYNLPRYFSFTDSLLRKIVRRRGHIGAGGEGRYEQRLQEYLQLKDIILYTSQDLRQVVAGLENLELDTAEPVRLVQLSSFGIPLADATIVPLKSQLE